MKVITIDKKKNFLQVEPENLDDLWVLNLILREGDLIGSKSTRRFRVQDSNDSEKKVVYLNIEVEKKELDFEKGSLKITGLIKSGSPIEYAQVNSYHSFDIMEGVRIGINKQIIHNYEYDLIEKSKNNSLLPSIYILVLDDDDSTIAKLNQNKYVILGNIKSNKSGKFITNDSYKNKYFSEIYDTFQNYKIDYIIVAGPGFEKENFEKFIKDKKDRSKFYFTHINSTGISGLNELIKGGSVRNILKDFKIQKDLDLIEEYLKLIAKNSNVAYGLNYVIRALELSAVSDLIVTDEMFIKNYDDIRKIFTILDMNGINYHIISTQTDSGQMLKNIGGIACKLYYKLDL